MSTWSHPYRLGRLKPVRNLKTPAFGDFLNKAKNWPVVKPVGWQCAVDPSKLLMLGNDTIGDCAIAGAYHWVQTTTAHTDNPLYGTLEQCISVYSAVTGYVPGDESTDNETSLELFMNWWKQNGLPVMDKNGKEVRHEIEGWANLDLTSVAQMRYAALHFSWHISRCQSAAERDERYLRLEICPRSPIIGGHCINQEAEGSAGGHVQTWGMNVPCTWEFLLNTLEEGYAIVSTAWVNSTGKAPSGLDLNGLLAAMESLGG